MREGARRRHPPVARSKDSRLVRTAVKDAVILVAVYRDGVKREWPAVRDRTAS
jgi:hypothetical protein